MDPFHRLREWHAKIADRLPALSEYVDAIEYNLESAEIARQQVRWRAAPAAYHAIGGHLYLLQHDMNQIVRAGDNAVRCAITALELGLQLMNYALHVAHPKRDVAWVKTRKPKPDFRAAVCQRLGADHAVVWSVDRIFRSHQYALFKDYRNWSAHRGAPRIVSPWLSGKLVPITALPTGLAVADEATLSTANATLYESCRVMSLPFVPPIRALIDDDRGQRPHEAKIGIAAPAESKIKFNDNYVVAGDPLMDKTAYVNANPIHLGGERMEVAGENLQAYSVSEYEFAVTQAVMFARDCLSGPWDDELKTACEAAAT